jgi:hypothetical protein
MGEKRLYRTHLIRVELRLELGRSQRKLGQRLESFLRRRGTLTAAVVVVRVVEVSGPRRLRLRVARLRRELEARDGGGGGPIEIVHDVVDVPPLLVFLRDVRREV